MVEVMSPYALIDGYKIINHHLAEVVNATILLETLEVEDERPVARLEESTFNVAEKTRTLKSCVTAHDVRQYINKFYSISLVEGETCLFDTLLDSLNDELEEYSLQE